MIRVPCVPAAAKPVRTRCPRCGEYHGDPVPCGPVFPVSPEPPASPKLVAPAPRSVPRTPAPRMARPASRQTDPRVELLELAEDVGGAGLIPQRLPEADRRAVETLYRAGLLQPARRGGAWRYVLTPAGRERLDRARGIPIGDAA